MGWLEALPERLRTADGFMMHCVLRSQLSPAVHTACCMQQTGLSRGKIPSLPP